MSENTGKIIELSDEEMDNVSGGNAVIVEDTATQRLVYVCNCPNTSLPYLDGCLSFNMACGHFKGKDGSLDGKGKSCSDCEHFNHVAFDLNDEVRNTPMSAYLFLFGPPGSNLQYRKH